MQNQNSECNDKTIGRFKKHTRMKSVLINMALALGSMFIALILAEAVAQFYVYNIAEQGKLFEPDSTLGWRVKPNLKMQRKNPNGDIWTIETDKDGFRIMSNGNSYSGAQVLILGDSFAFGDGVNIEDRFDAVLNKQGYSVINTGVIGYCLSQQLLKAEPHLAQLEKGDVVVVLTYSNDFFDETREKLAGRAKPWGSLDSDTVQIQKPRITLTEILRDKSYIYAKLGSLTEHNEVPTSEVARAASIYQKLIGAFGKQLANNGIRMIVAYAGIPAVKNNEQQSIIAKTMDTVCANADIECLNIDEHFNIDNDKDYFLADDEHWNAEGHRLVGTLILNRITGPRSAHNKSPQVVGPES